MEREFSAQPICHRPIYLECTNLCSSDEIRLFHAVLNHDICVTRIFLVTKAHRHERAATKIHITNFIRIILMINEFYYRGKD